MTVDREVLTLPIAEIAVGERIGFFNAEHAKRLGASMKAEGQHAPIHVRRNGNAAKLRWTLVAGLHRLRGGEAIGWSRIAAIQVADAATRDDDLRRLELAENLTHRHRRPIERAIMMAEHARLEELIDHPDNVGESRQQRGARMRHAATATVAVAESWRDRTAKAFGCSPRTLDRHQTIYRAIVEAMPDLAQPLNDHPLGDNLRAMERLASLRLDDLHHMRRVAAEKVLERNDWKTIAEAFEAAGIKESNGNRSSDIVLTGRKLREAWKALPIDAKRSHFVELAKEIPPSLVRETIEALKERLP